MQPHGFSVYDMVMAADPVVKFVMLLLVLASVACWAIILEKMLRLSGINKGIKDLDGFASGTSAGEPSSAFAQAVIKAAHREADEGAARGESRSDARGRLERAMRGSIRSQLQNVETGLPFLATIGSAAPFIGLFGTVWGIMNSFAAIAQKQDTSLATVAPGIAEALFATALGLAAAIPAVMAYNHFAVKLGRAGARGNTSVAEIAKHLSRPPAEAVHSANVEPLAARKHY